MNDCHGQLAHHDGSHIIMQVVGKCERSGTRGFRLENALGRETLPFFRVKWLPRSPKEGLCFRGFAARSVQVCLQNGTWNNNNNNLEESGETGNKYEQVSFFQLFFRFFQFIFGFFWFFQHFLAFASFLQHLPADTSVPSETRLGQKSQCG